MFGVLREEFEMPPHNFASLFNFKLNLVLKYNKNHIESSTPPFHEKLLLAWLIHKQLRQRVHPPEKLPYIPAGPLFQNELTSVNQEPVTLRDWNSAGITQIKDLT